MLLEVYQSFIHYSKPKIYTTKKYLLSQTYFNICGLYLLYKHFNLVRLIQCSVLRTIIVGFWYIYCILIVKFFLKNIGSRGVVPTCNLTPHQVVLELDLETPLTAYSITNIQGYFKQLLILCIIEQSSRWYELCILISKKICWSQNLSISMKLM